MNKYIKLSPYELLQELQITNIPVDPFEVAKKMGIDVDNSINVDKLSYDGEIFLNNKHNPVVWINPTNSKNRQNFTMAHEIGHLVYDVLPNVEEFKPIQDNYKTLRRDGTQNNIERRANDFAAQLLMPKEFIIDIGNRLIKNNNITTKSGIISALSEKFNVSEEAMKWRLVNLNLI